MYSNMLQEIAAEQTADRRRAASAQRLGRAVARAARRDKAGTGHEGLKFPVPMSPEVAAHAAQAEEFSGASR